MFRYIYTCKPSFIQYQLHDYWGAKTEQIFLMKDPVQYRQARKTMVFRKPPVPRRRRKRLDLSKFKTIPRCIIPHQKAPMKPAYFLRFPHTTPRNLQLVDSPLTPYEIVLYMGIPEFQGFFDDLFLFNTFSSLENAEATLNAKKIRTGAPSLHDMLIFELARIHTGHETYSGFLRNLAFFGPFNFLPLLQERGFVPSVQDFSRMFHAVPSSVFQDLFFDLLGELIEARVVRFRIMMWDCQFVHSNTSDYKNKNTGKYTDPDAGVGRHNNKYLGVGYMCSTLYAYSGRVIVPVYCTLFPANMSDKTIFAKTMTEYFASGLPHPKLLLGDSGAYSLANLELLAKQGIIGLLNAPKNITKQNVVELREDVHLNRDFIPASWSDRALLRLYAVRTSIERCFSHNIQVYNARKMNTRGLDQAVIHRYLILILDVLKILTAYKVGRPDLFQMYTAFSQMKVGVHPQAVQFLMRRAGYQIFDFTQEKPLSPRN